MNIPQFMPDQSPDVIKGCELSKSDATEWVVIHSFLVSEDEKRCCVSPPMLALKWEMAQVVFNSLLREGLMNTAQRGDGNAYLCRLNNEKDVFRVGIYNECDPEAVPEEVLMVMDRRSLTDEIYHELYIKDGIGETAVMDVQIVPPVEPAKPVLH